MEMQDPDIKLNKFLEEEKSYLEDLKMVDLEKNWDRFQRSIEAKSSTVPVYPFGRKYRFLFRATAAAILLLVVATTLYITTYLPSNQIIQARAEPGHTDIRLSDGTDVSLNIGAVLNYAEKLNRRVREVTLSGEAFFDVRHAEKSPFYVYVGEMTVQVVGTSFNIREVASGNIEVAVTEGEVLFYESGNEDEAIRITTGQRGVFQVEQHIFEIAETTSDNFLFWKTGTLAYKDTPLPVVFEELEFNFDREITVKDSVILKSRWNSIHKGQQLNEIIEELCLYFDLESILLNDTILIQRKQQ